MWFFWPVNDSKAIERQNKVMKELIDSVAATEARNEKRMKYIQEIQDEKAKLHRQEKIIIHKIESRDKKNLNDLGGVVNQSDTAIAKSTVRHITRSDTIR